MMLHRRVLKSLARTLQRRFPFQWSHSGVDRAYLTTRAEYLIDRRL